MQVPGDARVPSTAWTRLPSASLASKKDCIVKTSELANFISDPRHIFQAPGDGLSSSARRTRPAIATCRSSDHSVALNRMSYTFASLPEQPNHAAADPPFAMMLGAPALVSRRIAAQVPPELC